MRAQSDILAEHSTYCPLFGPYLFLGLAAFLVPPTSPPCSSGSAPSRMARSGGMPVLGPGLLQILPSRIRCARDWIMNRLRSKCRRSSTSAIWFSLCHPSILGRGVE
ncbi:hypothetical protein PLICRDRAFT_584859 [Plicaturopsis crispa FD-325 SS-3]|nr:hypothetical protein PLICRDRAFT_584859 [Plicaturopsis crispa FD-325 SS-3]